MILSIPQVAETETLRSMDVIGESLLYDEFMIRVFLTDTRTEERSVFYPLLFDRNLQQLAKRNA